ncbi:MAG: RsmD family RNA methyltransferase [Deltaproteobacteria bacterium]|nr:RsmD family RNA methyltransferase [Deltaproteobacteria bacterium]MBI3296435.1 RsmD family RNA methyltransferase [Deltaproteobacteria bacterium]
MSAPRAAPEIRPLTSIALKSCLDTLRPRLAEASVCDLFAGAGRFGEGCLKEGAARVVFVEKDARQIGALKKIQSGTVVAEDVFQYLVQCGEEFDIVFADPPFPVWNETFAAQLSGSVLPRLAVGGIFLVKMPKRVLFSLAIPGLKIMKSSEFGESKLSYWERVS